MIIEPKKTCDGCHWRVSEFCNLLRIGVRRETPACRGHRERALPKEIQEPRVYSNSGSSTLVIQTITPGAELEFAKVAAAKDNRKANRLFLKTLVERNVLDDVQIQKLSRLADSYLKGEP